MLTEKDILDPAAVEATFESLKPNLETAGFKIFKGWETSGFCIGEKDSNSGYCLTNLRGHYTGSEARPIEALCFLGYETFFPQRGIMQSQNPRVKELEKVILEHGIIEKLEEIAAKTKDFEKIISAFCTEDTFNSTIKEKIFTQKDREFSNYQRGALISFIEETSHALTSRGKDDFGVREFPFRELRNEYFEREPRHMRPVLLNAEKIIFQSILHKAEVEHENIFQIDLKLDPKGYELYTEN